jgi:murein DD-endopeptidase MepM/ murein hydrolase activator NlpD
VARARRVAAALVALAVLGGVGGAAAGRLRSRPPATYTLRGGDTLSAVALRFGTTVADLAQANGITDVHRVRAGQVLRIPGGGPVVPKLSAEQLRKLPVGLRTRPERMALFPSFDTAAGAHKVPPDLLKALAWMESGWQNDKVSVTKAVGIGQLMPKTVDFVNGKLLNGAALDPAVPEHNIQLSARYLAWLLQWSKGDVPKALAGYYQGPTSVQRDGNLAETDAYVAAVLALRSHF